MKKLALVMSLFLGAVTVSYAQDAKPLPRFAQPQNEADKPVVAQAITQTEEMAKSLKLSEDQKTTVLEINIGIARRVAAINNSTDPDKQTKLAEAEQARMGMLERHLSPKQYDNYQKKLNK